MGFPTSELHRFIRSFSFTVVNQYQLFLLSLIAQKACSPTNHSKFDRIAVMESRKRARADAAGSSPLTNTIPSFSTTDRGGNSNQLNSALRRQPSIPDYDVRTAFEALPQSDLVDCLVKLAANNPAMARWARNRYHSILEKERAKVINFDCHAQTVWYILNEKYSSMSGSKQYDMAGDAESEIDTLIDGISSQVKGSSSWGTKVSAIETLRKIIQFVCLSYDTLGHEVRKDYSGPNAATGAMIQVLGCLTEVEREGMCAVDDGTGDLLSRMESLAGLCREHCIGTGYDDEDEGEIDEVLNLLRGQ